MTDRAVSVTPYTIYRQSCCSSAAVLLLKHEEPQPAICIYSKGTKNKDHKYRTDRSNRGQKMRGNLGLRGKKAVYRPLSVLRAALEELGHSSCFETGSRKKTKAAEM